MPVWLSPAELVLGGGSAHPRQVRYREHRSG